MVLIRFINLFLKDSNNIIQLKHFNMRAVKPKHNNIKKVFLIKMQTSGCGFIKLSWLGDSIKLGWCVFMEISECKGNMYPSFHSGFCLMNHGYCRKVLVPRGRFIWLSGDKTVLLLPLLYRSAIDVRCIHTVRRAGSQLWETISCLTAAYAYNQTCCGLLPIVDEWQTY